MKKQEAPSKVLHFMIQDRLACMDLKYLDRVILLPFLETLPNGPHYLAGLLNVGGQSMAVIDLALRLGLERNTTYSLEAPVLLCKDHSYSGGMIVDKVLGIAEVDAAHCHLDDLNTEIIATIPYDSRLSLLINVSYLLATGLHAEIEMKEKINAD